MYSGSCDSVKSNITLNRKSSSESESETERDDSSYEETDDEAEEVESLPPDRKTPQKPVENVMEPLTTQLRETKVTDNNVRNEECNTINEEETQHISFTNDVVSGAATASEIFRHLQATRGKQEVTTELAKILNVLKTTLNEEKEESSSDEEQNHPGENKFGSIPTGKPPKPPTTIKFSKNSIISPDIQARIKDLEQNKHGNPKEEMTLLSKILVHLLCSCKTTAAAQELKRIIRQFKEVAKVAMEEGDDALESLRSSSRASSRSSKRRARSRTASGNSNISGNSETDSMNTLTPGDSKSSGTDDETGHDPNKGKLRFTSNVNIDKGQQQHVQDLHSCVSYTLTLPLKKPDGEDEGEEDEQEEENEDEEYDDDEWEWEYEDDEEQEEEIVAIKSQNNSSGSSRNLTPSDASTGSTRKIFNDMELGAYNTNSDPSHSNSQSTPITEEEDGLIDDDECEPAKLQHTRRKVAEKQDNSEHLFCHLEETFKVLSDTYKIITTGSTPDIQETLNIKPTVNIQEQCNTSFEEILNDVSTQCVQLETEIMKSSRQSTATPEPRPKSKAQSRPQSRSNSRSSVTAANTSRPNSRSASRPISRAKTKTPVIPQIEVVQDNDEEDWGDEDEWEYYYEEDYPEDGEGIQDNVVSVSQVDVAGASRPASRVLHRSRPASRQEIEKFIQSRPQSQQKIGRQDSRPSSRIVMRPTSRNTCTSRAASRCSVVNTVPEDEEEEWGDEDEWEYYYEEDCPAEEEAKITTKGPSRPASRSIVRSRPATKQEIIDYKVSRPSSSQSVKQDVTTSRPNSRILKVPASTTASRPTSRAVSRCSTIINEDEAENDEEDWDDEDGWEYYYEEEYPEYKEEATLSKPHSRPASRQNPNTSRPASSAKNTLEVKPVSRPASVSKKNVPNEQGGNWEYYYENDDHKPKYNAKDANCPPVIKVDNGLKLVSRPNSRNSVASSRPGSRSGSRSGSRPTSRTASRLKMSSALGNVDEEDEYEWYDDEDDPELARFSPTLTTAPTTRATSPFPDEKGNVGANSGTGFSRRKISAIQESEESTPVPGARTPSSRMSTATPNHDRRTVMSKTPTAMNTMTGVSVCLAAEYLGKDAEQLAASLPINFIEDDVSIKKKKHKSKSKDKSSDTGEEDKETRKKKKKSKRFLPKVGVRELASKLEPQLQFHEGGGKMTLSQDEVTGVIYENKKKSLRKTQEVEEKPKPRSPVSSKAEEKRRSVKEMVELMTSNQAVTQSSSPPNSSNIPSISVSSQMVMAPTPPHPYYANQNQQFMGPQYQPYPMDVHNPYSQYPPQSPHSPYQPYPPQSPYQQYPPQQYYQGYQPPPPPPMPQHYQQYQQQYPAYHPQQMHSYPAYQQGYPPPPQQPMVYHSDSNPNQMRVVSGGQTTVVNMRNNRSASRQKETSLPPKGADLRRSPNDSEAYGTGSTGSDQTESQEGGIDHDETKEGEDGKPHKRHSRLFKLLQDSDYTDSSDGNESRASEYSSRVSMKNIEDKPESDIDSVCSGLEHKSSGIERKHSFRSHKSSNKESDNDSVNSGGVERKISPSSIHSLKQKRFMQLNLQSNFDPSSSEVSTPNSPTVPFSDWRRSQSKPASRNYQYHNDDYESHAGVSDDSSYQSLQSLNSFDSVYDANAGREVEEIMKRKVNRDSLYRYQTDSPSSYVRASPKNLDLIRASPKVSSSSPKQDGKLEQELLELSNFPSSPGISLRQLQSHRSFYGNK